MQDDTAEPLRVIYRRDPCGAVASLEIWDRDTALLNTAASRDPDDALDHWLGLARDYYRADPHHDTLPPDEAVIAAWADYWGYDA